MAPPPSKKKQKRVSMEKEYHKRRSFTQHDIAHHHSLHGYDPLDKVFQEVRAEKKKRSWIQGKSTPEAQRKKLVTALNEHIETMAEMDLSLRHVFRSPKLGLSIVLAKYGDEGREHVQVEATTPNCELYLEQLPLKKLEKIHHKIMPTDEIIAINGELILEPTPQNFPQILKKIAKAGRPVEFTFVFGERREEAFSEQEERRKMQWEEPRMPDCDALLAAARAAAKQAAEGLQATILAVKARRPLDVCRVPVAVAEAGAVAAEAPARTAPRLTVDARHKRSQDVVKNCVKVCATCADQARRDADEAARLLRAYADLAASEAAEGFAAAQIASCAALTGVRFRDQKPAQPLSPGEPLRVPKPAGGFRPDATWCCGAWTLRSAEGVAEYCGDIKRPAPPSSDVGLDVAFAKDGGYEIRVTCRGVEPLREAGTVGEPLLCEKDGKRMVKTLAIAPRRVDVASEGGQQTQWRPGPGGSLVITSSFPRLTERKCRLTFVRDFGDMKMMDDDEDRVGSALIEGDEDPFAKFEGGAIDPDLFLRQLNCVVATAGLKYRNQRATIPQDEEDAWNIYIMTEHCAPHLEWLCGQWTNVATEGLEEYNRALGKPVPSARAGGMELGIAISGDKFYELHVRTSADYFIERGEFGKPLVIKASGGEIPKLCDVSATGRTLAVGTPGAQVVQIKRLSPTDPDLLMTTAYPELTDAVVCRVFTLKHKWAMSNGVGSGLDSGDVGMAYRLEGPGPAPATDADDFFGFDYTCGALGMRDGCYNSCVA